MQAVVKNRTRQIMEGDPLGHRNLEHSHTNFATELPREKAL